MRFSINTHKTYKFDNLYTKFHIFHCVGVIAIVVPIAYIYGVLRIDIPIPAVRSARTHGTQPRRPGVVIYHARSFSTEQWIAFRYT